MEPVKTKRRGRPTGWVMPTFADLGALTVEDFAFVRAVVGGMEPSKAWERFYANLHFDANGDPVLPHGHEINARARRLQQRIFDAAMQSSDDEIRSLARTIAQELPEDTVEEAVKTRVHRSFNDWLETLDDPGSWGERELVEMYEDYLREQQESSGAVPATQPPSPAGPDAAGCSADAQVTSRSLVIKSKIRAINYLQTVLASRPMADHSTAMWLAPALRLALAKHGIETIGALASLVAQRGRHWHRGIEKLGPGRAARLLDWLIDHQDTIGQIDRSGPQWSPRPPLRSRLSPLQTPASATMLLKDAATGVHAPDPAEIERRTGIAPFECLLVPVQLDGSVGLYRTQTPNHYGAKNDYEAVRIWLGTFLNAGKLRTFDAYRREIERFYLWCVLEAKVALSSVSLAHAMGYQAFLRSIPASYISTCRVTRDDPHWRPWRGQLTERNQAYALGIVSQFYNDAMKNAYVTGNPFASLKSPTSGLRVMDTTRSLTQQDLQWVRKCLEAAAEADDKSDLKAAIERRTRLILHLALSTGMRLEEIATTTLLNARKAIVDGMEQDDEWLLEVRGKGNSTRYLPISGAIYRMILDHHKDAEAQLALAGDSANQRLGMLRDRPPLVCALRAPVGHETDQINDDAEMASDNLALGRAGIYRTLKSFFRRESRHQIRDLQKQIALLQKRSCAAIAKGSHEEAAIQKALEAEATRELKVFERRANISTHWLRHTFAKAILDANPSDSGLKLTQQLLGHASINTTQLYIKQDESEKIRAVRRINPLGL